MFTALHAAVRPATRTLQSPQDRHTRSIPQLVRTVSTDSRMSDSTSSILEASRDLASSTQENTTCRAQDLGRRNLLFVGPIRNEMITAKVGYTVVGRAAWRFSG